MQKLTDFVPALSHRLKPLMRDVSQITSVFSHPGIDGGITLHSAIESQQIRRLHEFQCIIQEEILVPIGASSHFGGAFFATGLNSRSWKSKLKSVAGDTAFIRTSSMLPSGFNENVT